MIKNIKKFANLFNLLSVSIMILTSLYISIFPTSSSSLRFAVFMATLYQNKSSLSFLITLLKTKDTSSFSEWSWLDGRFSQLLTVYVLYTSNQTILLPSIFFGLLITVLFIITVEYKRIKYEPSSSSILKIVRVLKFF